MAGEGHPAFLPLFFQGRTVGHFPFDIAVQNSGPFLSQMTARFTAALHPSPDLFQERPIGQSLVAAHILSRIARADELHRVSENIAKVNIDGSGGAMEIHI